MLCVVMEPFVTLAESYSGVMYSTANALICSSFNASLLMSKHSVVQPADEWVDLVLFLRLGSQPTCRNDLIENLVVQSF